MPNWRNAPLDDQWCLTRFGARSGQECSAAIQTAIDAVTAINVSNPEAQRPVLWAENGRYYLGAGLTANKHFSLICKTSLAVKFQFESGVTDEMFTLNAENIAGISTDDFNHSVIAGITLDGSRANETPGASHAVYCPATGWSLGTQYSPSVQMEDVRLFNFTGDAVHLGTNRNAAILRQVFARYCSGNGLASYSYDHKLTQCDFGNMVGYAIRSYSGGAATLTNCYLWFCEAGLVVNTDTDKPWQWDGGSSDGHNQMAAYFAGTASHSMSNVTMRNNSRAAANTHSDIKADGCTVAVSNCQHLFENQKVKYLYESVNSAKFLLGSNAADHSGGASTPYGTAISNAPGQLDYGPQDANIATVTGHTTLGYTHHTVLVDASGGAVTITLPTVATAARRQYYIKKIDASGNAVTIDGAGAETIDGAATQSLSAQWDAKRLHCNGTAWYVL